MTILVVDDNGTDLHQIQVLLTAHGFEVVTAAHGAEALEKARQNPPDLVIADILMPVMDGFSLCREWKRDERLRPVPFLFYTATYTDERDREFALGLGAEGFFIKPEEPEVLLQAIREALRSGSRPPAPPPGAAPPPEGPVFLKQYNEALIRKLEDKMSREEQAQREAERHLAERARAETALQEERDNLRALFSAVPTALLAFDESERISYANPSAERLFGKTGAEMANLRCGDVLGCIHREEDPKGCGHSGPCGDCPIFGGLREVLRGGAGLRGREIQADLETPGGPEPRWFDLAIAPFVSQGRRRAVVALNDITEYRKLENRLRRDEERLRHLNAVLRAIRNVNQLIVREKEPEALIEEACRLLVETRGYLMAWIFLEDGSGRPVRTAGIGRGPGAHALRERFSSGSRPPCVARALDHGKLVMIGTPMGPPCRDCPVPHECRGASALISPLIHGGRRFGALLVSLPEGLSEDEEEVSLFREMAGDVAFALHGLEEEAERRRAESSLRTLSRRQEAILAAIPDIVMEVNPDKVYTWANPAGLEFFGPDVVGKAASFYFEGDQDTNQVVQPLFAGVEETIYVESWQRRRDGQKRLLAWWCRVLKNDQGAVTGAISTARDITDQRRVEEEKQALLAAIQHEKTRLSALIDAIPDEIWFTDPQGQFTLANPSALREFRLTGRERISVEDLAGTLEVLRPDGSPRPLREAPPLRALSGESVRNEEEIVRTPALGEWRHRQVTSTPVRDPSGRILGAVSVVRDITERKRAEEAILFSETRYRRLFESAKDGILILDAGTGKIVDANPFLIQLLGLPREQMLERKVWELGFFEDSASARDRFRELQEKEYVRYDDLPLKTADGRRIDVEFVSNVYEVNRRKVIQCNIRDITGRKRAEAEIEQLARFAEESPIPVLRVSPEGLLLYANPASAPLLSAWGISAGRPLPEPVRLRVAECHELNAHSSLDLEAGGRSYSLMIASVPGAGYLNLYGRDTTEQRRAEDQLRQSQKLEAIGRLAGGVAHDFNNLLAVIIGYSDLMLPQMEPSGELRQHLQEIRSAADRAAGLTRQLLAFSRKQVLQPKVLDINAVVTGMIRMIRRLVREDIELSTELSPEAGCVRADPVQMEQILLNLAANAGDAMPRGGRLTIRTARAALDEAYARAHPDVLPGDYALISVTDTGQGMDPETQARIFEPFFTTKDQGKGTGLGLSIVYGTVKQSGGHIDLESAPGQGTTFRVYLPGVRAVSEAQPRAAPEAKATPRGSETILVAEDDPVLRSMVVRILRDTGYKVLEAANGEEAKAVCARHRGEVHLLLTDVIMPVMGGTTLADHLGRFFPGMRTMFMSGHTNVAIDRPFLQKPFGTGELLKKIRDVLDAPGTGPGGGRSP